MRRVSLSLSVAVVGVVAGSVAAGVRLTDLFQFSTDSRGAGAGGQLWDTRTGGSFALWVSADETRLNGVAPATNSAEVDFEMEAGTYSFQIWGQPGSASSLSFAGLNLFFGDSDAPGISVFGEVRNDPATSPGFQANSAPNTFGPGPVVNGAGTLSYFDAGSGLTVTLSDYFYANPGVFSLDEGGPSVRSPGGGADFYGEFTLRVVPVPATVVPLAGLMLAGVRRRR